MNEGVKVTTYINKYIIFIIFRKRYLVVSVTDAVAVDDFGTPNAKY